MGPEQAKTAVIGAQLASPMSELERLRETNYVMEKTINALRLKLNPVSFPVDVDLNEVATETPLHISAIADHSMRNVSALNRVLDSLAV